MRTAAKSESKETKRVGKSCEDLANEPANFPFKSDERRVRHMYLFVHDPVLSRCAETPRYLTLIIYSLDLELHVRSGRWIWNLDVVWTQRAVFFKSPIESYTVLYF